MRNCYFHDLGSLQGFVAGSNVAFELAKNGSALFENNRFDQTGKQTGLSIIACSNVTVRNNRFNGGLGVVLHAEDSRGGISNVKITGNTFDHADIEAWGNANPMTNIVIDGDSFTAGTSPIFRGLNAWGNRTYTTLSDVQSSLGFESNAKMI
jgi:hypothetical protein